MHLIYNLIKKWVEKQKWYQSNKTKNKSYARIIEVSGKNYILKHNYSSIKNI